jgi:coenzyme F420 hydrogenase subunit beta
LNPSKPRFSKALRRFNLQGDLMFYSLKEEVIDPGFCVLCGSCSAFCDRIDLDYDGGVPRLVKPCVTGCSNCYDQCPMRKDFDNTQVFGNAKADSLIGVYREIKAVKTLKDRIKKNSQDGGAVTGILSAILERGKIDAAIVVERDEKWKPIPRIVTSIEGLYSSQGSKYSPSPNIESMGKVLKKFGLKTIAIVDVGCHIRGVRNLEYDLLYRAGFSPYSDLKIYTIGLFCIGSFYQTKLITNLSDLPEKINKIEINHGKFIEQSVGEKVRSVDCIGEAIMPSCLMCPDVTAEDADISIGSIGSPEGYSTVVVRNLMGWGMLRDAVQRGYVEADESLIDLDALKSGARKKASKVKNRIQKGMEQKRRVPGFMLSRRRLPQ